MRLPLEAKESECLRLIYNDKLSCEESAEVVIPDVCADVGKILDVRGQALMVSKRAVSEGLVVSACLEADVIFVTEEDSEPRSISAKLPFEFSSIAKGVDEDCEIVAALELCKLEARMLNPRKLFIRAELAADIRIYKDDVFLLWNDLTEADEVGVHLLRREIEHSLVMGVGEKSFTVSDEYDLPDGDCNSRIISCMTEICADDVKSVGNKLVVKASAKTNALMAHRGGEIFFASFETQFSQIIESDSASDDTEVDIILSLVSADFVVLPDRDDGVIAANYKICVQAVCVAGQNSTYVADAYSNQFEIELESTEVPILNFNTERRQRIRLSGNLNEDCGDVLYLSCGGVCSFIEEGKTSFTARVSGIGRDAEGELLPLSATLRGSEEIGLAEGESMTVSGVCCGAPSVPRSGEISLDLDFDLALCSHKKLEAISAIEYDEESPIDNENCASVVVICSERSSSLWAIAKKYGSTIETIEAANSLCGEFSESSRPLIVPRA